jgi:hypothetical protein
VSENIDALAGLYDVPPPAVVLLGGYHDGRRMLIPEDRASLVMPLPVSITPLLDLEPDVTRPSLDVHLYRWTGSIQDDGTRVFRFCP